MWAIVITFRLSSVVRPSTFHILIFSSDQYISAERKISQKNPEYMLNYAYELILTYTKAAMDN
jgi:hypothetical protein